jgi:hypothetical protein
MACGAGRQAAVVPGRSVAVRAQLSDAYAKYDACSGAQRLSQVQGSHGCRKQYSSDRERCRTFTALYFRTAAGFLMRNA